MAIIQFEAERLKRMSITVKRSEAGTTFDDWAEWYLSGWAMWMRIASYCMPIHRESDANKT